MQTVTSPRCDSRNSNDNGNNLRQRCAVLTRGTLQYLFVVVPRPPPRVSVDLEPFIVFDTRPTQGTDGAVQLGRTGDHTTNTQADDRHAGHGKARYSAGEVWVNGSVVIPLQVVSSGEVQRCNVFAQDEYESLEEVRRTCGPYDSFTTYSALFGALLLDRLYILVATQVQKVAALPRTGSIMRVLETSWIPFALPGVALPRITSSDRSCLQDLQQYSYSKGYYYSDDVDLRLPFPFYAPSQQTQQAPAHESSHAGRSSADKTKGDRETLDGDDDDAEGDVCANAPNFDCDWSEYIRHAFSKNRRLRSACSILLRGFAEERVCTLRDKTKLHMLLLGRQNNRNPGPRYLGRGLNDTDGVGNEHVYEYVMWRECGDDVAAGGTAKVTVPFARHTILRGTVPVRWTTQAGVSLAEPAMAFSANKSDALAGSDSYFVRVFAQLQRLMAYDAHAERSAQPRVRCVSLLRLSAQSGEDVLARYLRDAVRAAEVRVRALYPAACLDLVHVDWLSLTRDYGVDLAVSSVWEAVLHFLLNTHPPATATTATATGDGGIDVLAAAQHTASAPQAGAADTLLTTQSEDSGLVTVGVIQATQTVDLLLAQSRFVRVNCADSLDRTNLVCFFTCLQVSIAMLHTLCVSFDDLDCSRPLPPLDNYADVDSDAPYTAAFAPVSCARQAIPAPFLSSWSDARNVARLPPCVARQLAELFVENGDCVAMLYTNSAAMHGNLLRDLCGMKRTAHNAVIATQRRFENAFEDRRKLACIELLLGRNFATHVPSLSIVYVTRPIAHSCWANALLVVGVPATATVARVRRSLLLMWDAKVVPWLLQSKQPVLESTALCMIITMRTSHCCGHDVSSNNTGGVDGDDAAMAGDKVSCTEQTPPAPHDGIAVVEVDDMLCQCVNIPLLLRRQGYVNIDGRNCLLAPYSYPVQDTSDADGAMAGAVKNVGTALRHGIKKIVRNLN